MVRRIDFDDGFNSSTPSSSNSFPASDVSVTPLGNLNSDNAQDAFEELQSDVDNINSNISNVDNTSDINKPVSTAQAAADAVVLANAEAYTDTKITALINAAPVALDTLDELANALGDDPNFATTVSTALGNRLRVDTDAQGLTGTQKTNAKTNIDLQNVDNTSDATKNSATATLANKTLTSPVIDMGIFTEQGSTPSSPSAGQRKLYAKNTGKFYQLDSSGTERELGSGGTGVNFITGGDAEGGSIFATYKDSSSASPSDGTGGIPSIASASTSSSSPLSGSNSFLLTHPASNVQGEGWSVDFTIDAASKAKVLQVSFDYLVNSGTFVAGTSSTNSDVTVWIYDVTNATLIQPSSYKLLSSSSSIADKFSATFQTASNSTSYRLIFHCATTSASSFVLKVDSVSVSPSQYVYGTPITDWQSYTPTGSWSTNTTYTGFWRRVGKNLEYRIRLALAGAPTSASLTVNYLPSGTVVDTTNITSTATDGTLQIGFGVLKSAASVYDASAYYNGTSNLAIVVKNASGTYTGSVTNVNATTPATFTSGDSVDIWGSVPILGWSSSVQMSDQTDTRVVAAYKGFNAPTGTLSNSYNVVKFSGMDKDTHNGYNASTGLYTVPVSGYYRVSSTLEISKTSYSAGNFNLAAIYVNGSAVTYGTSVVSGTTTIDATMVSGTAFANAGDTIGIYSYCSAATGLTFTLTAGGSNFSLERISGPSAIAATESLNASYATSAGQSTSSGVITIVDYGTRVYDSHGSVTTGASWKFTTSTSGKFRISAYVRFASASWTSGGYRKLAVYKNGNFYRYLADETTLTTATHQYPQIGGATTISLVAGDYIDVRVSQNEGTRTLTASADNNFIDIERVGN